MLQKKFNSITYRITGLMFLLVGFTVVLLIYLANVQMAHIFQQYLTGQNQGMGGNMMGMASHDMMGAHEEWLLSSVHESLKWVGA